MAAVQDVDHQKMTLDSPGPSASQNAGRDTRIAESQGNTSQPLRVEVTVLRAQNVPHIKKLFGLKRRFFVNVTNDATVMETKSVQIDGETVHWNQTLGAFSTQRSSHLILRLYAKRSAHANILIGMLEIAIPVTSQNDIPFLLRDGEAGQSTQPITLYLKIAVSTNVPSPMSSNNPPKIPTKGDGIPIEGTTKPSMVPDSGGPIQPSALEPPLRSPDPLSVEAGTPTAHGQAETSPTENVLIALRSADEATIRIDPKNTWKGAVSRIKWVMDTISPIAELHPFAKMAFDLVSVIPETLLEQYERDENVLALLEAMHDAFDFAHHEDTLKSIKPNSKQAKVFTLMLLDICSCGDFIQSYAKDSQFWKRTFKNLGGGVAKDIEDLSAALVEHRRAFLDQAAITTEITAFQILDGVGMLSAKVDGISTQLEWVSSQVSGPELDAKIREIPYGTGSRFRPEKGCLPGTRTAFLDFIVNWVNDPASERSLVLFGQAGTGKSSIAHEIAHRFDKMHRLTSAFIFLRKEQSKREAYHLFTTLARDLSDRYPSFKAALGRVIKDKSSLRVGTRDYPTLFQSLILEPLKSLHIVGPIFVVIDALDESGDVTDENGLHKFLAQNLSRLPSNFRVFITSRIEDGIGSVFVGAPSVRIKHMNDLELAAKTHDDILTFFREKLPQDEFNHYGDQLAKRAEGLFQWASVACGFILQPPGSFGFSKKKCIVHLLRLSANYKTQESQDPLDELYKEVLEGYLIYRAARLLFHSVVGQLITTFEPLSIRSLTTLRHYTSNDDDDDSSVVEMLRHLGSLLSNVNSANQELPIVPLHTSFRDFLTNKEKSGDFYVSPRDAHYQLAHSCLGLLLKDLKFNICNIESSYLANKDIEDLNSRVDKHIPPALLYACRFWGDHLEYINFEVDLFEKLRTFFEKKFLFWLEALSLTSDVGLASAACSALNVWLASGQGVSRTELEKFRSFVNDASVFVRYFGRAMAKSAPHVYLSALPFAPTRSLVSAHYSSTFPRILRVERGLLSHWPSLELVISDVGDKIHSIALSPDGQRIVSCSDDGTIRVWNATTGENVAGPFTGLSHSVRSVAFSPDGQCIVSGSDDGTIRVWNATTGETEVGRFTGHTHSVRSVAFSPDGRRIVSGSFDGTIRVWNSTTGEAEAAGPFTGYMNSVWSVAFSPDGQRIVSGSFGGTIHVWNATTGEKLSGPFTGHTHSVRSVAFSPDGQRIVSGSEDRTIRVWDATTGEAEADPFTGHTRSVTSVAFSPDGQRIVSGSFDRTIRVWSTTTGETEAGPYTGHTRSVMYAAFSPDGQRIVSGSDDGTIRMWNATTGETEASRFTRHRNSVWSVALSPDGQRIVSGSDDGTIHVWDATTGKTETEAGQFTGHTSSVTSVAFSPDGQRIVSGSDDGTIFVWNTTTGENVVGPLSGHTVSVRSVAFSPDGRRIISGSDDRSIRVWDATTGETEADPFTGHTRSVTSVAFSPDGQRIVSGSDDRTIRLWNATTGETEAGPNTEYTDLVRSIAFSPDGQRIVSGSDDGTIRVWNATTGGRVAGPLTGHKDSVRSVALSLDGKRIVSGSDDGTIRVWNATTRVTEAVFTGHVDSVMYVAFSPDGQRIVSGSDDRSIRMWNAAMREKAADPFTGHTRLVRSVSFSPDGRRIVSGSDDRSIRVWDATTGEKAADRFTGHKSWVMSVAFSPDGQRIVSGSKDRTILVWNATTGQKVSGPFTGHRRPVRCVAFSPDGQRIASGSEDRTICVWNATTGEKVTSPYTEHTGSVTSVVFSPDGQRIVSGSDDETIRVWNATTGEMEVGRFEFTGYMNLFRTIRVSGAMTGEAEADPFPGHTRSVTSVAFSPDGQRIVSGSEDRTICVWNATTGVAEVGPFTGHSDSVTSVAFSPDGQVIVSGSKDRRVRVWNATTGEKVTNPYIEHTDSVTSVAFSPDGLRVVSSGGRSIHVLNMTTGKMETAKYAKFTDGSEINDEGWICGGNGELLMWIPPIHRKHLHRPSNMWVAGEYETRMDLSTFVLGPDWATCIDT